MCRYRIQLLRLYACHGASAIIGHANVSQITIHSATLMTVMVTLAAQWQMIPLHVVRIWSLFFSFHVQRRSHRHIRSGPSDTVHIAILMTVMVTLYCSIAKGAIMQHLVRLCSLRFPFTDRDGHTLICNAVHIALLVHSLDNSVFSMRLNKSKTDEACVSNIILAVFQSPTSWWWIDSSRYWSIRFIDLRYTIHRHGASGIGVASPGIIQSWAHHADHVEPERRSICTAPSISISPRNYKTS